MESGRSRRTAIALVVGGAALVGLAVSGLATVRALQPTLPPVPTVVPRSAAPADPAEERRRAVEALQDPRNRVVEVSGPSTRGSAIQVAGRVVQLPPDAYVETYTISATCLPGKPCPQAPLYTIRRGQSKLTVSQPSGVVVEEKVMPGEEGVFESIRRQLP